MNFKWESNIIPFFYNGRDIAWSPELERFAMVGDYDGTTGHIVAISHDGIQWTAVPSGVNQYWSGIVWSAERGIYVAVAEPRVIGWDQVMISPDGMAWESVAVPSAENWSDIAWSPALGLFVAVSRSNIYGNGNLMVSPDGSNWDLYALPTNSSWSSIAWSPTLGLFASISSYYKEGIAISSDGVNWDLAGPIPAKEWRHLEWIPELERFVAVGPGTEILVSSDGTTWQSVSIPVDAIWCQITWSSYLRMAAMVGFLYGPTSCSLFSPDLVNWSALPIPGPGASCIAWAPSTHMFFAGGCGLLGGGTNMTWRTLVPVEGVRGGEFWGIIPELSPYLST